MGLLARGLPATDWIGPRQDLLYCVHAVSRSLACTIMESISREVEPSDRAWVFLVTAAAYVVMPMAASHLLGRVLSALF